MKHLTMADKSLLVGDQTADLLMEYAALLARQGSADTIEVQAIGDDGDTVTVTFLLNSGTVLLAETSTAAFQEPDNSAAIEYIRASIDRIENPPMVRGYDDESVPQPQWDL